MRTLITGATGFVGRHLAEALLKVGHEVVGLARRPTDHAAPIHPVDLRDRDATTRAIADIDPDWIFHLAGFANPGQSFRDPDAAWDGNLAITRSLYAAIQSSGCRPRILYVSTGLVYGDAGPGERVCTEETPLRPASPYAASKAAADLLSYQQSRSGLDVIRVRPFNQIGPGQSADYAVANFARQIAAIECGELPPIVVTGDLSGQRDLTDIRDMVQAYIRLMEAGEAGEVYNAGSGRTYVIRDVLQWMIGKARVPVSVDERIDPARARDTAVSRADTRKIREATGWQPAYSLEQSLEAVLEDWRCRPKQGRRA
jgi:GDP-4-dehydro-6-deoxy-D-mannose reductase